MEQVTMFENIEAQPLAARLRPVNLEEFVGQKQLLGEGMLMRKLIEKDQISSMIFWGRPVRVMRLVIDQMNMRDITICYGLTENIEDRKSVV